VLSSGERVKLGSIWVQTGFELGSNWVRTGVAPNGLDPLDGRVGLVPTLLQEVTRTVRQGSWAIVNRDAGDAG
jgi:hypothetical protein